MNPYALTNKVQSETLDYVNNLCYCYDCDLPNPPNPYPNPPNPYIGLPCTGNPFYEENEYGNYERAYKVKSYVGLITPKHYGGVSLSYSVCNKYEIDYEYEYQKDRYKCTNGTAYLFGTITPNNTSQHNESLPINYDNYEVYESLYSGNDQNIYDATNWTSIQINVSEIAVGHGG